MIWILASLGLALVLSIGYALIFRSYARLDREDRELEREVEKTLQDIAETARLLESKAASFEKAVGSLERQVERGISSADWEIERFADLTLTKTGFSHSDALAPGQAPEPRVTEASITVGRFPTDDTSHPHRILASSQQALRRSEDNYPWEIMQPRWVDEDLIVYLGDRKVTIWGFVGQESFPPMNLTWTDETASWLGKPIGESISSFCKTHGDYLASGTKPSRWRAAPSHR